MTKSQWTKIHNANDKHVKDWNSICKRAKSIMRKEGIKQSHIMRKTLSTSPKEQALQNLYMDIKKFGLWETFRLREENYQLALYSEIFKPIAYFH